MLVSATLINNDCGDAMRIDNGEKFLPWCDCKGCGVKNICPNAKEQLQINFADLKVIPKPEYIAESSKFDLEQVRYN